jgi:hypothetical protein
MITERDALACEREAELAAVKPAEIDVARALQARTLIAALGHFEALREIALQHEGARRALCGESGVSTPLVRIELTGEGFRITFSDPAFSARRFTAEPGQIPYGVPTIDDEIRELFGALVHTHALPTEPAPVPVSEPAQSDRAAE